MNQQTKFENAKSYIEAYGKEITPYSHYAVAVEHAIRIGKTKRFKKMVRNLKRHQHIIDGE